MNSSKSSQTTNVSMTDVSEYRVTCLLNADPCEIFHCVFLLFFGHRSVSIHASKLRYGHECVLWCPLFLMILIPLSHYGHTHSAIAFLPGQLYSQCGKDNLLRNSQGLLEYNQVLRSNGSQRRSPLRGHRFFAIAERTGC